MPRPRELPARARIVIIGGGVGGCAIAYHLARLGERDVVLVDRNELTSGSTFHSAGLVGQLRGSVSLTRMMMDSVELYRTLDCGWAECGGIRLACTPEREQEIHRQVAWARTFGLPLELISAQEAQERFPLMVTDGVRVGSFLPTDGYLDPSQLTYALADGARAGGARIFTHTRVNAIGVERGAVRSVETEWGTIECEVVVNAGGMYAAEIGRMAGVRVPIVPFAHEYLVTQPFYTRTHHLPTLRDPDNLVYYREEGEGLVMGGYERNSAPWSLDEHLVDRIPPDFNGRLLEEDWPRFEEIAEASKVRVPAMERERGARVLRRRRVLRARSGWRGRHWQADGRVDPRGRARARRLGDGHPPLRAPLPLAVVHPQARQGGLRDLLRHPLPRRGPPSRPPAARLQRLRMAPRPRRGLRREGRLGARQLVRRE
jgi:glycine/D-amino acid oxidase-like deaminating enzyme